MNTKKAFWVKRPKSFIKIDLHSFSWTENEDNSSVYWTLGEEGFVRLEVESEGADWDFVMLHTPSDYLRFSKNEIISSFFSLNSSLPFQQPRSLTMEKNGSSVSFLSDEELVIKIENPAFLGSASFGIVAKGKGKIKVSVF